MVKYETSEIVQIYRLQLQFGFVTTPRLFQAYLQSHTTISQDRL